MLVLHLLNAAEIGASSYAGEFSLIRLKFCLEKVEPLTELSPNYRPISLHVNLVTVGTNESAEKNKKTLFSPSSFPQSRL